LPDLVGSLRQGFQSFDGRLHEGIFLDLAGGAKWPRNGLLPPQLSLCRLLSTPAAIAQILRRAPQGKRAL